MIRAKMFPLCILFAAVLLIACPMEESSESGGGIESLHGKWAAGFGDYFEIHAELKTLYYYDGGNFGSSYRGNIMEVVFFTGNAGVILIEFTEKPIDFSLMDEPEGDFIGIYFRNLTETSGEFGLATDSDFSIPAKNSLQEAKAAFTEGAMGGYFTVPAVYTKSND